MPWTDRGEGVSPVAIQLLGRALSSVPIDDLRQFVALMEAVESVPSPTARPRRAFDRSGRRRAHDIEADGHLLLLAGRNAAAEGLETLREIPIQKLP